MVDGNKTYADGTPINPNGHRRFVCPLRESWNRYRRAMALLPADLDDVGRRVFNGEILASTPPKSNDAQRNVKKVKLESKADTSSSRKVLEADTEGGEAKLEREVRRLRMEMDKLKSKHNTPRPSPASVRDRSAQSSTVQARSPPHNGLRLPQDRQQVPQQQGSGPRHRSRQERLSLRDETPRPSQSSRSSQSSRPEPAPQSSQALRPEQTADLRPEQTADLQQNRQRPTREPEWECPDHIKKRKREQE